MKSNANTVTGDPNLIGGNTILRDANGYKLYKDIVSTFTPNDATNLVAGPPTLGVGVLSYTDTASAREVKGTVERRGLCGDIYVVSTPAGPTITDVTLDTSVRTCCRNSKGFVLAISNPCRLKTSFRLVLPPAPLDRGRSGGTRTPNPRFWRPVL